MTFRDFFVTLVVALIFHRFIFWLFFECVGLQKQNCGKYVLLFFFRESVKQEKKAFVFIGFCVFYSNIFKELLLSKTKGMKNSLIRD